MEQGATSDLDRELTVEGYSTALVGSRVPSGSCSAGMPARLVNEA
jgi:hypothetical protein